MILTITAALAHREPLTGSAQLHPHGLVPSILFTDGVKYVADRAYAYWLLDEIALAQHFVPGLRKEPFQHWQLVVQPKCRATVTSEDGDGTRLYQREIEFTDVPQPGIAFYLCDGVILLPSEL